MSAKFKHIRARVHRDMYNDPTLNKGRASSANTEEDWAWYSGISGGSTPSRRIWDSRLQQLFHWILPVTLNHIFNHSRSGYLPCFHPWSSLPVLWFPQTSFSPTTVTHWLQRRLKFPSQLEESETLLGTTISLLIALWIFALWIPRLFSASNGWLPPNQSLGCYTRAHKWLWDRQIQVDGFLLFHDLYPCGNGDPLELRNIKVVSITFRYLFPCKPINPNTTTNRIQIIPQLNGAALHRQFV